MVAGETGVIRCEGMRLSYGEADQIAKQALAADESSVVRIDLEETTQTCTAALARLIMLRCALRKTGRDLRLIGLHGPAEALYQVCRLNNLLPRQEIQRQRSEVSERVYLASTEAGGADSLASGQDAILMNKEFQPCQC